MAHKDPTLSSPARVIVPCVPTVAADPQWIHEIKQDGYRMIGRRANGAAQLLTRNGFDWTKRYPLISAGPARLPATSATIDGEAAWVDDKGVGDFQRLHSRTVDREVTLIAFDLLARRPGSSQGSARAPASAAPHAAQRR